VVFLDNQLFEELVNNHKHNLAHLCTKLCGNYEDAADLYQETLMKVYCKFDLFNADLPFEKWLYSICVNVYKNFVRAKKRRITTLDFFTTDDKEFVLQNVEDKKAISSDEYFDLHIALSSLKEKYKTVIVLYYFTGYNINDISKIIDIPEGTVKYRLFKARELLKRRLYQNEKII
jgi:RNA polymerase sigma-70 factor (ECF subfamily)